MTYNQVQANSKPNPYSLSFYGVPPPSSDKISWITINVKSINGLPNGLAELTFQKNEGEVKKWRTNIEKAVQLEISKKLMQLVAANVSRNFKRINDMMDEGVQQYEKMKHYTKNLDQLTAELDNLLGEVEATEKQLKLDFELQMGNELQKKQKTQIIWQKMRRTCYRTSKEIHLPFFVAQSNIYFSNKDQVIQKFRRENRETQDFFAEKDKFLRNIIEFVEKISLAMSDIPNLDLSLCDSVAAFLKELEKFYGRAMEFHRQILQEHKEFMYLQSILDNFAKILEIQTSRVPFADEYLKKQEEIQNEKRHLETAWANLQGALATKQAALVAEIGRIQHQISQQQSIILRLQMRALNGRLNQLTRTVNDLQRSHSNLISDIGKTYSLRENSSNSYFLTFEKTTDISFVPKMMKTKELPGTAEQKLLNIQSLANLEKLNKEVGILTQMADANVTLCEGNYLNQKARVRAIQEFLSYHEDLDKNLQIRNGYLANPSSFMALLNVEFSKQMNSEVIEPSRAMQKKISHYQSPNLHKPIETNEILRIFEQSINFAQKFSCCGMTGFHKPENAFYITSMTKNEFYFKLAKTIRKRLNVPNSICTSISKRVEECEFIDIIEMFKSKKVWGCLKDAKPVAQINGFKSFIQGQTKGPVIKKYHQEVNFKVEMKKAIEIFRELIFEEN